MARAFDAQARRRAPAAEAARALAAELRLGLGDWLYIASSERLTWQEGPGLANSILIGDSELEIVRAGLDATGVTWPDVRTALVARVGAAADLPPALRAAGRLAPAGSSAVFPELCSRLADTRSRQLRGCLEGAIAAWIERTAATAPVIRAGLDGLPPSFVAGYIDGALASGDVGALRRGIACIGVVREADAFLTAKLADIAGQNPPPFDGLDFHPLVQLLDRSDASLQIEACRVLGALDAIPAVPALIDLIERARAGGVREAARVALERISGERLITGAEHWRAWHEDVQTWERALLPGLTEELRSGDRTRVSRALLEVARCRMLRHRTAPLVIAATRTHDTHVLGVAASVLGHLGTRTTIVRLIQLLEHQDLEVRRAAFRGLRHATGRDLDDDPARWRQGILGEP